jgi:Lsr2
MTPSATPMLIDDSGQLQASERVRLGVDGRVYEIELSARRASELRSMVGRYIRVARKIPSAPSRGQQPRLRAQMAQEQSRRIGSTAKQRGLLTSPRGRIPQHLSDEYQATVRVAPVASRLPGTAEPAPTGGATAKPPSGSGTACAAQDEPAGTANMAATGADVRGGEHGLTDREKQELRAIADSAKPLRDIVAGRLRTKRLADRDTAGNWWLTDAGRCELTSA